jgi:putative oxidoreductase
MFLLRNKVLLGQWAPLPIRLIIGFGFLAHGWAKWGRGPEGFGRLLHQIGIPLPVFMARAVTLIEMFGGLAILAGAFLVVVSVPLLLSMVVAMFTIHWRYGFSSINTIGLTDAGPVFGPPGYEVNLLYIAGLFALILAGPSPLSIDRWLARRRETSERAKAPSHAT